MKGNMFTAAKEAIRNLFRQPNTVMFPTEHVPLPEDFRGKPILTTDACALCSRCARVCPTNAITIEKEDKKTGTIKIDMGKCCYCGECENVCHFNAIKLSNNWLTASLDKESLIDTYRISEEV